MPLTTFGLSHFFSPTETICPPANIIMVAAAVVVVVFVVIVVVGNADIFEIKYRDSGGRGVVKS